MSYTYYSFLAFITPDSGADLAGLQASLQVSFSRQTEQPVVVLADNDLTVSFEDYSFYIDYAAEAHVQEEAQEFAADNPLDLNDEPIDAARLAACTRRFELRGDPDPDMEYFNESLSILQALEELEGVLVLQLN